MSTLLAPTLESFFTDRLLCQKRVSPNTIASYRDTFRLLLRFVQEKTGIRPARLELTQLDAPMIGAFLEHLETERGNRRPHPERPARDDSLVLSVLRAQASRARGGDCSGARDPRQTQRATSGDVPAPRGGQSALGEPRSCDLGREA
jgi:Phage integrase, N-terminal SAM-like domain